MFIPALSRGGGLVALGRVSPTSDSLTLSPVFTQKAADQDVGSSEHLR